MANKLTLALVPVDVLIAFKRGHYECEDCWYSCGKAGCCNPDTPEDKCTCGADLYNAEIDKLIASPPEPTAALEGLVEAARALKFGGYPAHGSGFVMIVTEGNVDTLAEALAIFESYAETAPINVAPWESQDENEREMARKAARAAIAAIKGGR